MSASPKRRRILVTIALFLVLALPVTEIYLRLRGNEIYESQWKFQPGIGWHNRQALIYSEEGRGVYELFWDDGTRASRYPRRKNSPRRIAVVGCSFTEGVGVRDQDTFVWKLNDRFPHTAFDNYGCSGYSPYQCYLLTQEILSKNKYDLVLYCAIGDHLLRFLKPTSCWITSFSDDQLSIMPWTEYAEADNKYHPGFTLALPGARRFLSLELLNYALIEGYGWLVPRPSEPEINAIFQRTVEAMSTLCTRHRTNFAVVLLNGQNKFKAIPLRQPTCIAYYPREKDGFLPDSFNVEPQRDAHPNRVVHHYWALVIGRWLEEHKYINK